MGEFRHDLSQAVLVPIPAAGAGFTYTLPGSEYSRLRSVAFSLTTSSATATRTVSLSLRSAGGVTVARIPSPASQTASQTDKYTFGVGLYPYSVNASSSVVAPLPDLWLPGGSQVIVTVASIDTADTITVPLIVLDQIGWIEAQEH